MPRETRKPQTQMLITTLFIALSAFAHPKTNVVYDGDHRVDIYQVGDPKILERADSTVAMFATKNLLPTKNGFDTILDPMEKSMHICHGEKFAEQPTPADCSGVLVAPNRIMTAGHCISHKTCSQSAFVFGYRMTSSTETTTHFPLENVYYCSHIVARKSTDTLDYAVVELDRSVLNRTPVPIATDDADEGDEVYLLSHPAGTPLKFSVPVKVTKSTANHFTSPIDALGGSSGGPMFSRSRNELVGILVSGEEDYVDDKTKSCRRVNNIKHCGQGNDCDGEDATHVSVILDAVAERSFAPKP